MWPFRRKEAPPPEVKLASLLLSRLGYSSTLASPQASYQSLAAEGYAVNFAVNACVNRIAAAVSSVEPVLYRRKGQSLAQVEAHPLLDLLARPNATQARNEFMAGLVSQHLISGNAYVYGNGLERRPGEPPRELQLLNPGKVRIEPGALGYLPQRYEYRPQPGRVFTYEVDQITGRSPVMHVKTFNPLDQWYGLSPLIAAAYGVDILNSGQKWNKRLLDNDARPSGALVVKGAEGNRAELSEEQYLRLRQMVDDMFSGADNAGRPLLLEGGLEWQELSMSARDMDFLQAKHSSARDIGLVYGVPPQLLGIPDSSTFANYEQANLSFWTDTALPTLCRILEAFNLWLTPLYGDDLYLWYSEDEITALEPLRKQKADRINAAGYMTVNEKRRAMGLDDVDGGDVVLVPSSTIPLDLAGQVDLPEPGSPADPANAGGEEL